MQYTMIVARCAVLPPPAADRTDQIAAQLYPLKRKSRRVAQSFVSCLAGCNAM